MNRYAKLRALVALADHGTFSRAAEALGLSQPALTRRIQALESRAGSALLERGSRRHRLTPLGQDLVSRARKLLDDVDALDQALQDHAELASGSVWFGTGPHPTALLVPGLLADLSRRHPGLTLNYEVGGWQLVIQRLREQQLDVVIADGIDVETDPDLQVSWLKQRAIQAVTRVGHPLAEKRALSFAGLAGYPLVSASMPPRVASELGQAMGRPWAPEFVCDDVATQVAFLRVTDGVMLMPAGLVGRFPDLTALDLGPGARGPVFHWAIIRLARHSLSPAAQKLVERARAIDRKIA